MTLISVVTPKFVYSKMMGNGQLLVCLKIKANCVPFQQLFPYVLSTITLMQ